MLSEERHQRIVNFVTERQSSTIQQLMEELGIYEVAEEDFALCEFADTSKTDIQAIIRKGLDLMVLETR